MTGAGRVVVRESIAETGIDLLRAGGLDVVVDADTPLEVLLADADALIIRSATKVTAEVLALAPVLKVIGRAGVGVDNVDVEAAHETRDRGGERARVERRSRPPSTRWACSSRWPGTSRRHMPRSGRAVGALALRRCRAGRQDARRARARPHRPTGGPAGARTADEGPRPRPVRVAEERFRELGVEPASFDEVLRPGGLPDAPPSAQRRDARRDRSGPVRAHARRRAHRERSARGAASTRPRSSPRSSRGRSRVPPIDVFADEPYAGPLLHRTQRRGHAASRGVDRRGAGPGRRDRRGAGRGRAAR